MTGQPAHDATGTPAVPVSFPSRRVVLDTNVLLCLYVFVDSRFAPIRQHLEAGRWLALTNPACLREFQRVIARPQFGLEPAAQAAAIDSYARVALTVAAVGEVSPALPRCKDRDDQKFLELARDGRAQWLVTADKALLRLARKQRLADLFAIITPDQAVAA